MRLVLMNIPETGATAVERVIDRVLGPGASVCPLYRSDEFEGKTYTDAPGYDVYRGNLKWDFVKDVPADYIKAVLVRRPADQVLSLADYIASQPNHPLHERAMAGTAELLQESQALHNMQSKYLLGMETYRTIALDTDIPVAKRVEQAVEAVKRNLAAFHVVGLANDLAGFVKELGAAVGTELPKPVRASGAKSYALDTLPDADRALVEQATWLDRPVFQMIWTTALKPKMSAEAA